MAAPIIGITTSRTPNPAGNSTISTMEAYVTAVLRAGGTPVLLPVGLSEGHLAGILPHLDAVLFTGGGDIDPALFQGEPHPRVGETDHDRDRLEVELAHRVFDSGLPFLGICRGIQMVNVALGGSLYTDLADQHPAHRKHDFYPNIPRDYLAHEVDVVEGSRLAQIVGAKSLQVNSLHHQGIKRLAGGLVVDATSTDGVIEAVELPGHPFGLAVQWHPEWLPELDKMQALFRALVEAARA
ncbi:MAG: gamma-glutamyl-gamma-aminobutyrate hydrolase family protein [Chloroflexi bacterium]|nr:gamma-glutamyl-gamma-aminobutyrate hydrolase family protein [Chloroflexota bacterium]